MFDGGDTVVAGVSFRATAQHRGKPSEEMREEKAHVWTLRDGVLRFASEAKALSAEPTLPRSPDPHGFVDVLHYGHVVEDRTMFEGVSMVLPATMLVFEDGRLVSASPFS